MERLNLWEQFKDIFRKGKEEVSYLMGEELNSVFDHERVGFNKTEYERIDESFKMYAGDYPAVSYRNSEGKTKTRPYMHLNMLNEVSRHLGSILFNEQCKISFEGEGLDTDFIEHTLEHNDFMKNFSKYIQVMLATGGLTVKPYYDASVDEFEFSWGLADTFIPLRSNSNSISEAVITSHTQSVIGDKKVYYTLLEFHEWDNGQYVITNELYRSDKADVMGKRVPLDELYEDLNEETVFNNLSRPNFAYASPFGFNNQNPQSPLGLGIADNAKETLQQINDTYDQYHWEIKQGKRKIAVSDHFLKTRPDAQGRPLQYFDDDTDVFQAIPGGMDDMVVKDLTLDIRSQEYIESINKFMQILEMQVGLSAGTFTFDGKSMKTATEVVSEDSMTYRTRNSHLTNIEQFIQELIISLVELASETLDAEGKPMYQGRVPNRRDIVVDFDDGLFTDKAQELEFWSKAKLAGLAPDREAMKRIHNLSDEEADKWYKMIQEEQLRVDPMEEQRRAESTLLGDYKE